MSENVFAFPSRSKGPQPWTNDELAELYRVVDLLGRAGLAVATDMGLSDEGDPWFIFCRVDNEEVIAHFARIDGHFVAASIAVDETFRGANFRQIVDRMVSSQPLVVPKPGSGSRLLMHPAVLLTAFVATALAHSEKMLAQDFLRSVEAQWDHSKTAVLHEIKHIKTGWLDTLHSLWKLPLHDGKLAHDAVKETQALTLASLIAIAMAALQPIAEKISVLSQIIADEFPGHGGNTAQAQAAHAAQLAQDAPMADMATSPVSNHGNGHAQSGDDTPQSHKIAAAPADGGSDSQKTTVDGSHVVSLATVQKMVADDAVHTPVHAADAADVAAAYLLMQQKTATITAAQTQAPEPAVFHVDIGSNYIQTVNVQDVSPEALQFLSIHVVQSDSGTQKPGGDAVTSTPPPETTPVPTLTDVASTGGSTSLTVAPTPTSQLTDSHSVSPVAPTPSPTVVGPQEINTNTASGAQVIEAITAFANNAAHTISKPSDISFSASLQQELSGYLGGGSSLKIIIFDSTAPIHDVFSFAPGVVFVADKDLDPQSLIRNNGGNLTLDVANGQQVVLVGVATIDYHAPIA